MFKKELIIKVSGMKCEHCAKRVFDELSKLENVKKVKVHLSDGKVKIKYVDELNIQIIKEKIEELGYKMIED